MFTGQWSAELPDCLWWRTRSRRLNTLQEAIASQGMSDDFFFARVEEMADRAFDDQCTGANPRYWLIEDLKQLLLQAYSHGDTSEVD